MYSKEDFLEACEQSDGKAFLEAIYRNGAEEDAIDLEEIVSALTAKELERCWTKLAGLVAESLAVLSNIDPHERNNEEDEVQRIEELIVGIARFALIVIDVVATLSNRMPTGLLGFAGFFNDIVTVFTDNPSLMNSILKLCELWWQNDFPNKNTICFQAFYYMLKKSLKEDAKKSEVKRVFSMHSLLTSVCLDKNKSTGTTALASVLLKTSKSSLYLKMDEGVKFLGFLFTLSDEFVKSLHEGIKEEMVTGNIFDASRYGQVYLEAFAAIPNGSKEFFEKECLQDLMYLGVHVKSNVNVHFATNVHVLLHVIHAQKKANLDVGTMVYNLYQPFLWKCLTVPNWVVRGNAGAILLDLFPLENPGVNIVENDSLFNKQINLFEDILTDPVAVVRQKGVMGVCKIVQMYWDVIPTRSVQRYMEILTTKSLMDACSNVRYAAVVGFQKLLDLRAAIPMLKAILPKWGCAFNDVNLKVRAAMADLLLKIKCIRCIKYWDIVSTEDIVARLAVDDNFMSTKLAKLVFNSYHPQNDPDNVLLDRVISLLKLNPDAAKRMYMLSTDLLDLNNGVKFILIIMKAVKLQYKRHSKHHSTHTSTDNEGSTPMKDKKLVSADCSLYKSDNESGKEEQKVYGDPRAELDKEVLLGLLDIAAILLRLYQRSLREECYSGHLQMLTRASSHVLPKMMSFYKNYPDLSTSILCVASFLPSNSMHTMIGYCKSRLRSSTTESEYQLLLDCLINWRRGDDILELVTEWLEAGMTVDHPNASRQSSLARKGVKFAVAANPRPNMAIIFITHCLSHNYLKAVLLEKNRNDMLALLNNLEPISDIIQRRLMSHAPLGDLCTDGFLYDALVLYLRLASLLHKKGVFDAVELISKVIDSLDSLLLKVLDNTDVEYNKQDVNLAMNFMNALLCMNYQIVLIGYSNTNFNLKIISLVQKVLLSSRGTAFLLGATQTLFQVAEFAYISDKRIISGLLSEALIHLFEDVMKCMAAVEEITEIETSLRSCLQETMAIYSSINNQTLFSEVCLILTTTAIVCQLKSGFEEVCEKTRCLMLAAAFRVEPLRCCMAHLRELADSDALESKEDIIAVLHIITIVPKNKSGNLTPLFRATMECKNRLPKQVDQPENQEAIETKILDLVNVLKKDFGIMLSCG